MEIRFNTKNTNLTGSPIAFLASGHGWHTDWSRMLGSRTGTRKHGACPVYTYLFTVFQLGLFLRALRPARTGLRPARFTRFTSSSTMPIYALKIKKKKKCVLFDVDISLPVSALCVCCRSWHDRSHPGVCVHGCHLQPGRYRRYVTISAADEIGRHPIILSG